MARANPISSPRVGHAAEAAHVSLGGAADPHPRQQADDHTHDEEGGGQFVEPPVPAHHPHDNDGKGAEHEGEDAQVGGAHALVRPGAVRAFIPACARIPGPPRMAHRHPDPEGQRDQQEDDPEGRARHQRQLRQLLRDSHLEGVDGAEGRSTNAAPALIATATIGLKPSLRVRMRSTGISGMISSCMFSTTPPSRRTATRSGSREGPAP